MSERKKQIINLSIKIIILIFLHLACSYAIACWGVYVKWKPDLNFSSVECIVQELLFMAVFQIFIYVNYRVKRMTTTKYKVIYIISDLLFLMLTFWFWCGPKLEDLWF